MKIYLIRHGKTAGNISRKYIGTTDEPLADIGICELEQMSKIKVELLFCSPKKRALQTAEILVCREKKAVVCEKLAECDFGDFENKTAEELSKNPDYIRWVESGCTLEIPNGESMASFSKRSVESFYECVEKAKKANAETVAIVAHGGTVMAVMSDLFGGEFYSYRPENGGGYVISQMENGMFENCGKI